MLPSKQEHEFAAEATAPTAAAISHHAALVRFARSLLADPAAAEDVAQETLLRFQSAPPPAGETRPWLYRIARNLCLDILRRRNMSPTRGARANSSPDPAADTAGPATRAAADDRREFIHRALEAMPNDYREVLILKHFEGLSREEIASVLELSEQAVKGRLVRASEYLREQLRSFQSGVGRAS